MKNIGRILALSFGLLAFAGPGFADGTAAAPGAPEVFTLKVTASLEELTADLEHPGGVKFRAAEGVKTETVSLPLNTCETFVDNSRHCSATWSKVLTMDGNQYSYFLNVYNTVGSDMHSVVLNICLSGETEIGSCRRWMANQMEFKGAYVPMLKLYDSSHWNDSVESPASYQPVLTIESAQ